MNKKPHRFTKPKTYKNEKVQWTAHTTHIDEETGEVLTKNQTQNGQYIKTNTEHNYTIDPQTKKGHCEYITKWKRNSQRSIFD